MNTTPPPAPPQVAAGTPAAPAPVAGLAYHRLSHADPKSRWFSPLLEGLLGVAVFIGLNLIISVALAVAIMGSGLSLQDVATNRAVIMEHPALFALTFLSLIAIVPSLFLARLVVGPSPGVDPFGGGSSAPLATASVPGFELRCLRHLLRRDAGVER